MPGASPPTLSTAIRLARLLVRTGHKDEALQAAKIAESVARSDADRRLVQSLMSEIQRGG